MPNGTIHATLEDSKQPTTELSVDYRIPTCDDVVHKIAENAYAKYNLRSA